MLTRTLVQPHPRIATQYMRGGILVRRLRKFNLANATHGCCCYPFRAAINPCRHLTADDHLHKIRGCGFKFTASCNEWIMPPNTWYWAEYLPQLSAKYPYTRTMWLWTEAMSVLRHLSQPRKLAAEVRLTSWTNKVRVRRNASPDQRHAIVVGIASAIRTKASHLRPKIFELSPEFLRFLFRPLGFGFGDVDLSREFLHLVFQLLDSGVKCFDTLHQSFVVTAFGHGLSVLGYFHLASKIAGYFGNLVVKLSPTVSSFLYLVFPLLDHSFPLLDSGVKDFDTFYQTLEFTFFGHEVLGLGYS